MKSYKVILLNAEIGYKLHNKIDDIFCAAVQLPIDSNLSDWEEVTDEEAEEIEREAQDEPK